VIKPRDGHRFGDTLRHDATTAPSTKNQRALNEILIAWSEARRRPGKQPGDPRRAVVVPVHQPPGLELRWDLVRPLPENHRHDVRRSRRMAPAGGTGRRRPGRASPRPNFFLATTTAAELAAACQERWEFESSLDEIKTHQRGRGGVLRSKSPEMMWSPGQAAKSRPPRR
jgi:hypothetical protein